MNINKYWVLTAILLSLPVIGIGFAVHGKPLIWQSKIRTENFGEVSVAYPVFGSRAQVLVFVDTKKFHPKELAQRIANTGAKAVILDSELAFKRFIVEAGHCLDSDRVAAAIGDLMKNMPMTGDKRLIVSGIGDGALIPFLNAVSTSEHIATNLSIGFSAILPADLALCPPLLTSQQDKQSILTSAPGLKNNWRIVWTDQPLPETAIFVRKLPKTDTRIAAYDSPFDTVLVEELQTLIGQTHGPSVTMPVVEVPVASTNETVTLFYSGDGGWRDLDRIVAGEMANRGYPVVGIDTLRDFWSRKTPEQAANELAETLRYYRKAWGAKSFVLAGYSFGADILPAIYNRLTQTDQDSVHLLVLLALAKQADFEIHVSGWLGQNSSELPVTPELAHLPKDKLLCIYGREEKDETACTALANTQAELLELPGGHHFDQDYPKLTRLILESYQKHGL